ncbi:MAG: D-Ala-D-Ala carboxypeptidase family metallohydrolase [Microvirga sp.]|nr:D-Ala-D-Ala carboxypeptidase family metallohydrolase [Microvirga sp.]
MRRIFVAIRPPTVALAALAAVVVSPALAATEDSTLVPAHIATQVTPVDEETRTANLDAGALKDDEAAARPRATDAPIATRDSAPTHCLPGALMRVLTEVAERFGDVSVQSTHRSHTRNARAGGARRSLHLDCRAVDFRVKGDGRAVLTFLRDHGEVGGVKRYRNGLFHIDDGAPRSW